MSRNDYSANIEKGLKAMVVQPFTEAHSKKGNQFESAFYQETLTSGSNADLIITTGVYPLSVKGIELQFNNELISSQLFVNPSYTGGVSLGVFPMRDGSTVTPLTSIEAGVVVSATGTAVSPQIYSLGSTVSGNKVMGTLGLSDGIERVLEANSTYLYRITNEDTASTSLSGIATWYEGQLDL